MRILIVEDDVLIAKAMQRALIGEGFAVDVVQNGHHALTATRTHDYVAMILDLGLPDMEGTEVLSHLRNSGHTLPVLLVTARDTISDRVTHLDLGADDFIVKPFDLDELSARLRACIRRSQGRATDSIRTGQLELLPSQKSVYMRGEPIALTGLEYKVLATLVSNKGKVLSRQQIEEAMYGWGEEIESNSLEVHIHHLRKKLGKKAIETIHGLGYRMGVPE